MSDTCGLYCRTIRFVRLNTCRKSTDTARWSTLATYVAARSCFLQLYKAHVSQFDRCWAPVNLKHVCWREKGCSATVKRTHGAQSHLERQQTCQKLTDAQRSMCDACELYFSTMLLCKIVHVSEFDQHPASVNWRHVWSAWYQDSTSSNNLYVANRLTSCVGRVMTLAQYTLAKRRSVRQDTCRDLIDVHRSLMFDTCALESSTKVLRASTHVSQVDRRAASMERNVMKLGKSNRAERPKSATGSLAWIARFPMRVCMYVCGCVRECVRAYACIRHRHASPVNRIGRCEASIDVINWRAR